MDEDEKSIISIASSILSITSSKEEDVEGKSECSTNSEQQFFCKICGEEPCTNITYRKELEECLEYASEDTTLPPENKRFKAYTYFVHIVYGRLGKNVRVPIPVCIFNAVQNEFPDPNGIYTGFRPDDPE